MNVIKENGFSNPESEALYKNDWLGDVILKYLYEEGRQCGGCTFFAPLNSDWGICCHKKSKHFKETIFEHFTCKLQIEEGWSAHSFTESVDRHIKDQ